MSKDRVVKPADDAVDDLLDAWQREFPDPVHVFEEVAARLGLQRHSSCSLEEWREARVRAS